MRRHDASHAQEDLIFLQIWWRFGVIAFRPSLQGHLRVHTSLEKESGAVITAHVLPENYSMVNMFAHVGTDHRMFSRLSPHRFAYLLGFRFPFFDKNRREMIMGTRKRTTE